MKTLLLLVLTLLIAGCQQVDSRAECARLTADTAGLISRSPHPAHDLDPVERSNFYLAEGDIELNLRILAEPYSKTLRTTDPFTFCQSLTGRNPLPSGIPNPHQ